MKSKLKYYAQIIGVNLLAILVPHPCCCPYLWLRQVEEYLYPSLRSIAGDIRLLLRGNHRGIGWFLRRPPARWLG